MDAKTLNLCSKETLIAMVINLNMENTFLKAKYEIATDENNPYFENYIAEWLEKYKYLWQETTYKGYRNNIFNHIIPYFKTRKITIKALKPSDLEAYYADLIQNGLSPNTTHRHHANIRKCLRTAQKDGLIRANPAQLVDLPTPIKPETKYYDILKLQQLLKKIRFSSLYPIVLLASIGLRRSEAIGVKWTDIDFDEGILRVQRKVMERKGESLKITSILKTRASYRTIKLPSAILCELNWIYARQVGQFQNNLDRYCKDYFDYICVDVRGNLFSPSYASGKFADFLKKEKLPYITIKGLRHSCATILLTLGFEIKHIQEWLGHSTIVVTGNTYAHIDMSHKMKMANALEDVYSKMKNTIVSA